MELTSRKIFDDLRAKTQQFSTRETILVSLTSVVLIVGLAYAMWISAMERRASAIETELKDTQRMLDEARILISGASDKIQDPNAAKRARMQELLERLRTAEAKLTQSTHRLTQAADVGRIVDRAMARYPRIHLEKIENKPPVLLLQNESAASKDLSEAARKLLPDREFILYQHTILVAVRGPFPDLVAYVKRLEDSSHQLFLGDVTLKTDAYPDSILSMELITLSPKRTLFDPATAMHNDIGHDLAGQ